MLCQTAIFNIQAKPLTTQTNLLDHNPIKPLVDIRLLVKIKFLMITSIISVRN